MTAPSASCASADERADPLALSLSRFLKDRSLVDKILVYRALLDATANVLPETGAQDRALSDVRACAAAIRCPEPSKKQYVTWRAAQPSPNEFLSDSAIRNAFGGWRRMLAALGAPTVADPTALRLTAVGSYTPDGLLDTLTAWYEAIGGPAAHPRSITQSECHRWMDERRRAGDRPDLELPRGTEVWSRHFGGWMQSLAAAGLLAHRAQAGIRTHLGALEASDEQLAEDLRRAADALGGAPTVRQFDAWVVTQRAEAATRNEIASLFQSETYQRRFGSWVRALHRAGLLSETELFEREGRTSQQPYADDETFRWLREYLAATTGKPTSGDRYTTWRKQLIAANAEVGKSTRIPSERYVRGRFGSFKRAIHLAQQGHSATREVQP